jgi:hypothetical protein
MWKTKFGNPTPLRNQSDSYKEEDMTADKREYPKKDKEDKEEPKIKDYQKDASEGDDNND